MAARDIVVHPVERRLRAPFRLALHGGTVTVLAIACAALGAGRLATEWVWVIQLCVLSAATLVVGALVDHRRHWSRTLGLDGRGVLEATGGALLGGGLVGAIAIVEVGAGLARFAPVGVIEVAALVRSLVLFAAIALSEELIFRAYLLTNVTESLTTERRPAGRAAAISLVLSALVFGAAHATNPNATAIGVANVALAGALLAIPFVLRGRLGPSLGLHFGWNLAQSLLDMPVSGQRVGVPLVERTSLGAGELVTGGAFGPEGGLSGLAAITLGIVIVLAWGRRTA